MRLICPACGALSELDAMLQHEYARKALTVALACPAGLATRLPRYLRLFVSPSAPQRALTPERYATLLSELTQAIKAGAVEAKGRRWSAPEQSWVAAFDAVFSAAESGALKTPLRGHAYLFGILANQANAIEAKAETAEEQRRAAGQRPHVEMPVLADPAEESTAPPQAAESVPAAMPAQTVIVRQGMPIAVREQFAEIRRRAALKRAAGQGDVPSEARDAAPEYDQRPQPERGSMVRVLRGRHKDRVGSLLRLEGGNATFTIHRPRVGEQTLTMSLADLEINP